MPKTFTLFLFGKIKKNLSNIQLPRRIISHNFDIFQFSKFKNVGVLLDDQLCLKFDSVADKNKKIRIVKTILNSFYYTYFIP